MSLVELCAGSDLQHGIIIANEGVHVQLALGENSLKKKERWLLRSPQGQINGPWGSQR